MTIQEFDGLVGKRVAIGGRTWDYAKKLKAAGFTFDEPNKLWRGVLSERLRFQAWPFSDEITCLEENGGMAPDLP